MKEVTITKGQNIFDITLQEYGSVEAVFDFLNENPNVTSLDQILNAGDKIQVDEVSIKNFDVVEFFSEKNIKPNTEVQ